mmetsp:Transcript_24963/g.60520  ORF Transcript_24963/g.60520 Transcript_24963/m.60520 type:complete len:216 (-) Transcript_24963:225-872(-)
MASDQAHALPQLHQIQPPLLRGARHQVRVDLDLLAALQRHPGPQLPRLRGRGQGERRRGVKLFGGQLDERFPGHPRLPVDVPLPLHRLRSHAAPRDHLVQVQGHPGLPFDRPVSRAGHEFPGCLRVLQRLGERGTGGFVGLAWVAHEFRVEVDLAALNPIPPGTDAALGGIVVPELAEPVRGEAALWEEGEAVRAGVGEHLPEFHGGTVVEGEGL